MLLCSWKYQIPVHVIRNQLTCQPRKAQQNIVASSWFLTESNFALWATEDKIILSIWSSQSILNELLRLYLNPSLACKFVSSLLVEQMPWRSHVGRWILCMTLFPSCSQLNTAQEGRNYSSYCLRLPNSKQERNSKSEGKVLIAAILGVWIGNKRKNEAQLRVMIISTCVWLPEAEKEGNWFYTVVPAGSQVFNRIEEV